MIGNTVNVAGGYEWSNTATCKVLLALACRPNPSPVIHGHAASHGDCRRFGDRNHFRAPGDVVRSVGGLFRVGYRPAPVSLPIGSSPIMLLPPNLRQSPEWGADTYAAFRSVVSSAKANGRSVLHDLRQALAAVLPGKAYIRPG